MGGEAGLCFHPEHETDLALHESLTDIDERELTFLRWTATATPRPGVGEAGLCFHPEHELDLSLHESLTGIDELELRHLCAPSHAGALAHR